MDNEKVSREKTFPYIIVDSSFVLADALSGDYFDKDRFIENCLKLRKLKRKRLRVVDNIREEVKHKLNSHAQDTDVAKAIESLHGVREWNETDLTQECFLDFFRRNLREIGENLGSLLHKSPLSHTDIEYCALALLKSRYEDVIAATRDRCIMDSLSYAFALIHPIRKRLSWPDTNLFLVRNYQELERQVDYLTVLKKLSNIHEGFSTRHYGWDNYRLISRDVWQRV